MSLSNEGRIEVVVTGATGGLTSGQSAAVNDAISKYNGVIDQLDAWQVVLYSPDKPIKNTTLGWVRYFTVAIGRANTAYRFIRPSDYGLAYFELPLSAGGDALQHYIDVAAIGTSTSPLKSVPGGLYDDDLSRIPIGYSAFGQYHSLISQEFVDAAKPSHALLGIGGPPWVYDLTGVYGTPSAIYAYPNAPIFDYEIPATLCTVKNTANVTSGPMAGYVRFVFGATAEALLIDAVTGLLSLVGFGSVAGALAANPGKVRILATRYGNMLASEQKFEEPDTGGGGGGGTTADPRLVLPSKVHAIVGLEFNLYYDAIALLPDVGTGQLGMLFDVQCDIGTTTRRSFRVTPTAAMVGNHALTIVVYDNKQNVIATKTTTLVVKDATGPTTVKRILSIGDSTTDDTGVVTQQLQSNLAALPGTTPTFIGTHGVAPYNMEARSGQTFSYYANGGDNRFRFTVTNYPNIPFWPFPIVTGTDGSGYILPNEEMSISGGSGTVVVNVGQFPNGQNIATGWTGQLKIGAATFNVTATTALPNYSILKTNGTGALSFANYISRFGFAGCDLLTIDLGINDCRGVLQNEATQLAKITDAKAVIASARAYNSAMKVIVCLTKSGSSTPNGAAGGTQHDSYRLNIHRLRELIIENFDNGAYNANVSVCASGIGIDRFYGYQIAANQPVAARYSETENVHVDFVHPRSDGYKQVADMMTGAVVAALT